MKLIRSYSDEGRVFCSLSRQQNQVSVFGSADPGSAEGTRGPTCGALQMLVPSLEETRLVSFLSRACLCVMLANEF